MAGLQEIVHIIPLGHEYDRAVAPFKKHSVDRVYILSVTKNTGNYADVMLERQIYFTGKVLRFFEKRKIETVQVEVELFDILEVMRHISDIIKKEHGKGNSVHLNVSACGRKTAIGAALAGMANGATVYYVSAETYALDYHSFEEHGLSICESGNTFAFENFEFDLPNSVSQKILIKLYQENRGLRTTSIREFLHTEGVEGFEINVDAIPSASKEVFKKDSSDKSVSKREESIAQAIKLEKKYLGPLERSGYIRKERSGRNNIIYITESGNYVACINGMI